MSEYMLTTTDNPYNPYDHWSEWYVWDADAGYHTPSYLDRVAFSSYELSERDQNELLSQAIDEVVTENITGTYIRIRPNGEKF